MVANVSDLCIAELRALHEAVDIKPVCLVRRDTPGGGVRLFEIPHLLKVGHLVADRCRGKADIRMLCDRAGADRRGGHDIIVNDRLQDLHFSCIQFHSGFLLSRGAFLLSVSTHAYRVLNLTVKI